MTQRDVLAHALRARFGIGPYRASDEGFSEEVIQEILTCILAALPPETPAPTCATPAADAHVLTPEEVQQVSLAIQGDAHVLPSRSVHAVHRLADSHEALRSRVLALRDHP